MLRNLIALLGNFLSWKSQTTSRLRFFDRALIWVVWGLVARENRDWRETARVQINALILKSDAALGEESFPTIELLTVATNKDFDVFP